MASPHELRRRFKPSRDGARCRPQRGLCARARRGHHHGQRRAGPRSRHRRARADGGASRRAARVPGRTRGHHRAGGRERPRQRPAGRRPVHPGPHRGRHAARAGGRHRLGPHGQLPAHRGSAAGAVPRARPVPPARRAPDSRCRDDGRDAGDGGGIARARNRVVVRGRSTASISGLRGRMPRTRSSSGPKGSKRSPSWPIPSWSTRSISTRASTSRSTARSKSSSRVRGSVTAGSGGSRRSSATPGSPRRRARRGRTGRWRSCRSIRRWPLEEGERVRSSSRARRMAIGSGRPEQRRARQRHSTLASAPMKASTLRKAALDYRPELSDEGPRRRSRAGLCDGGRTMTEIAQSLQALPAASATARRPRRSGSCRPSPSSTRERRARGNDGSPAIRARARRRVQAERRRGAAF